MAFPRVKKRRSFLVTAASGQRFSCGSFLLQSIENLENGESAFGFTATRRLGKAVQRSRARRRLKAAVELAVQEGCFIKNRTYVFIARPGIFKIPFDHLLSSLKKGLLSFSKEKMK